jgi:hypothetical protein
MIKCTFVLDDESAVYLARTAQRLGVPKSQVVREALRVYGEQLGRLSDEERDRALAAFDRAIARVPERPREDVQAELNAAVAEDERVPRGHAAGVVAILDRQAKRPTLVTGPRRTGANLGDAAPVRAVGNVDVGDNAIGGGHLPPPSAIAPPHAHVGAPTVSSHWRAIRATQPQSAHATLSMRVLCFLRPSVPVSTACG